MGARWAPFPSLTGQPPQPGKITLLTDQLRAILLGQKEAKLTALKLSQDLRPMSDLKSHGADIVRQVNETQRPIVLTRHGMGVAVVLSLTEYEEYQAIRSQQELQAAIHEAEEELAAGAGISHATMMDKLRDWSRD